jgi:hypothetical protein
MEALGQPRGLAQGFLFCAGDETPLTAGASLGALLNRKIQRLLTGGKAAVGSLQCGHAIDLPRL